MEIAFGRLKARWRRLSKQIDIHIDNVPYVIAACCVLHNMCEIHHDRFNREWLRELLEVDVDQPENVSTEAPITDEGNKIRTLLMNYFSPIQSSLDQFGLYLHYKVSQISLNCFDPEH